MLGMDEQDAPHVALNDALQDDKRIDFHRDYLSNLSAAIRYTRNSLVCLLVRHICEVSIQKKMC